MKKRTAITGAVVTALTVGTSMAVLPSAAQAAYACRASEVCLYQDWGLKGSTRVFRDLAPGNGIADFRFYTYTNGANLNDSVSSIYNRAPYPVYVYEDGGFSTGRKLMKINAGQIVDFNIHTALPNDVASSMGMVSR
ncbi:peptidase inhibitor family I36 protein [Actinoplanes sp. TRM 88003]|uniref:Peptidase inhibitor family I36 protein n=1 Tax=Paractinoplanes aksuensis TaxID=2939490 RepID=A0ABT1DS54_9ACTN|nr:peptidase inhibitor family I36 protein [Actinoplanes aksuensis]MCO8273665.1 peptidase inhibitor family I36 protein [Actinoplanes aksuensis]